MTELKIIPYTFDRDNEVLDLLHKVFQPWTGNFDYFVWKYRNSQVSNSDFPRSWIIEHKDRIVGFNGYLPRQTKLNGEKALAVQSFDTAIDPTFRGMGLFGQLQQKVYEELSQSGFIWIYGCSNELSFKILTKKVDWNVWGKQ